jgi:hypothetical protein
MKQEIPINNKMNKVYIQKQSEPIRPKTITAKEYLESQK